MERNITSASSVSALANEITGRFGRLDVVVVNSGASGAVVPKLTDADPTTFQQRNHVSHIRLFLSAKSLLPILLGTQGGAKNFIMVLFVYVLHRIELRKFRDARLCICERPADDKSCEAGYRDEGLLSWSVDQGSVDSELTAVTPEPFQAYLLDSPDLCGAFCTWLSRAGGERAWLCGRLVNAKYDVSELEARKDEVVEKDLLKLKICALIWLS